MIILSEESFDAKGLFVHKIDVQFMDQIFELLIQENNVKQETSIHVYVDNNWRALDRSIKVENILLEDIKLGKLIELKYKVQ
jgi:acyl CoA:acetate/3-ketoacid CoA transferase alpha subunit